MTIYSELLAASHKATIAHSGQSEGESDQAYIARLVRAVSTITGEEFNEILSEKTQVWFDVAADALNAEKPLAIPEGFREPPPPPVKIGRPRPVLVVAPAPEPEPEPEVVPPPPAEPAPMPPPAQHPPTPPLEAEAEASPVEAFVSDIVEAVKPKRKRTRKPKAAVEAAPPEPPEEENVPQPDPEPVPITEPEPEAAIAAVEGNGVSGGPTPSQRVRQYLLEDQQLTINDIVERLRAEHLESLIKRSTISTLRYDTVCTLLLARQAGWGPQPQQ